MSITELRLVNLKSLSVTIDTKTLGLFLVCSHKWPDDECRRFTLKLQ